MKKNENKRDIEAIIGKHLDRQKELESLEECRINNQSILRTWKKIK